MFAQDSLAGRTVLITGASSGIGRATAITLSQCGARLVLTGRNEGRLREAVVGLDGEGHETVTADLSDADSADAMATAVIAQVGPLDGAFYSAGETLLSPVRMTKTQDLTKAFGAGFYGAFGVARALSRKDAMVDGGSIVFMSSVAAARGRRGMSAYSASKAALGGLVRALAIELAPRGIRVNSIAAGGVMTAMHNELASTMTEGMIASYKELHILGFGTTDDIANAATFLLGNGSRWITGQDLAVDGGYTAK